MNSEINSLSEDDKLYANIVACVNTIAHHEGCQPRTVLNAVASKMGIVSEVPCVIYNPITEKDELIKSPHRGMIWSCEREQWEVDLVKIQETVETNLRDEIYNSIISTSIVLPDKVVPLYKELGSQVGGNHYADNCVQPILYAALHDFDAYELAVLKYLTRHKKKGKHEDIDKAIQYLLFLRAAVYPSAPKCEFGNKHYNKIPNQETP